MLCHQQDRGQRREETHVQGVLVTVQVVTTGITPQLATSARLQEVEKELLPHAEPLHTLR